MLVCLVLPERLKHLSWTVCCGTCACAVCCRVFYIWSAFHPPQSVREEVILYLIICFMDPLLAEFSPKFQICSHFPLCIGFRAILTNQFLDSINKAIE